MAIGLVGSGPAVDAVTAALGDIGVTPVEIAPEEVGTHDCVVAAGASSDDVLTDVNRAARNSETPWIGIELGGIGGVPVAEAAVAGFGPETGCYDCLHGRVEANTDDADNAVGSSAPTARYAGAVAGLAAAEYLDAADDHIFGTVHEIPHGERPLLPLPHCPCGETPEPPLELTSVDRPLDDAIERAERALDDRVGIIQQVGETESFPVPYYLARLCETDGFSDATAARDAAGVALDWDTAFMKALGEALERYCAGVYRTDQLIEGPPAAVENAVPPSAFVCRDQPDDGTTLRWADGLDLHRETQARLPAAFVQYPPPTPRYRPAITTGLGLGNGGVEAVLAGLTEVVERDAAILAWYSTYEPLGLTVDDEGYAGLVARARSADLTVTPVLLTQDVDVPVVAVAVQREDWPRFAIGLSANLDAGQAARGALAEALQNWMELRGMGPENAADASGAIGHYAADPGVPSDFVSPSTTVPAETVGAADSPTGAAALETLLGTLESAGLTAYAARTTTRDVADLGFEAVRVLVPGAQPLFFGDPYFGERAEQVPESLGYAPTPDRDHHPYP